MPIHAPADAREDQLQANAREWWNTRVAFEGTTVRRLDLATQLGSRADFTEDRARGVLAAAPVVEGDASIPPPWSVDFAMHKGIRGAEYWLNDGDEDIKANRKYGAAAERAAAKADKEGSGGTVVAAGPKASGGGATARGGLPKDAVEVDPKALQKAMRGTLAENGRRNDWDYDAGKAALLKLGGHVVSQRTGLDGSLIETIAIALKGGGEAHATWKTSVLLPGETKPSSSNWELQTWPGKAPGGASGGTGGKAVPGVPEADLASALSLRPDQFQVKSIKSYYGQDISHDGMTVRLGPPKEKGSLWHSLQVIKGGGADEGKTFGVPDRQANDILHKHLVGKAGDAGRSIPDEILSRYTSIAHRLAGNDPGHGLDLSKFPAGTTPVPDHEYEVTLPGAEDRELAEYLHSKGYTRSFLSGAYRQERRSAEDKGHGLDLSKLPKGAEITRDTLYRVPLGVSAPRELETHLYARGYVKPWMGAGGSDDPVRHWSSAHKKAVIQAGDEKAIHAHRLAVADKVFPERATERAAKNEAASPAAAKSAAPASKDEDVQPHNLYLPVGGIKVRPTTAQQFGRLLSGGGVARSIDFPRMLAETGWASNGNFLLKVPQEHVADLQKYAGESKGGPIYTAKERDHVITRTPVQDAPAKVIGVGEEHDKGYWERSGKNKYASRHKYLLESPDGTRGVIDAGFVEAVKRLYPDATLHLPARPQTGEQNDPIHVRVGGQTVGVVTPYGGGDGGRVKGGESPPASPAATVAAPKGVKELSDSIYAVYDKPAAPGVTTDGVNATVEQLKSLSKADLVAVAKRIDLFGAHNHAKPEIIKKISNQLRERMSNAARREMIGRPNQNPAPDASPVSAAVADKPADSPNAGGWKSPTPDLADPPPSLIANARYAKGKMAVQVPDIQGMKSRAGSLAEGVGGKWTGREKAYIMSPNQVARLKVLYESGWRYSSISGTFDPPEGVAKDTPPPKAPKVPKAAKGGAAAGASLTTLPGPSSDSVAKSNSLVLEHQWSALSHPLLKLVRSSASAEDFARKLEPGHGIPDPAAYYQRAKIEDAGTVEAARKVIWDAHANAGMTTGSEAARWHRVADDNRKMIATITGQAEPDFPVRPNPNPNSDPTPAKADSTPAKPVIAYATNNSVRDLPVRATLKNGRAAIAVKVGRSPLGSFEFPAHELPVHNYDRQDYILKRFKAAGFDLADPQTDRLADAARLALRDASAKMAAAHTDGHPTRKLAQESETADQFAQKLARGYGAVKGDKVQVPGHDRPATVTGLGGIGSKNGPVPSFLVKHANGEQEVIDLTNSRVQHHHEVADPYAYYAAVKGTKPTEPRFGSANLNLRAGIGAPGHAA